MRRYLNNTKFIATFNAKLSRATFELLQSRSPLSTSLPTHKLSEKREDGDVYQSITFILRKTARIPIRKTSWLIPSIAVCLSFTFDEKLMSPRRLFEPCLFMLLRDVLSLLTDDESRNHNKLIDQTKMN